MNRGDIPFYQINNDSEDWGYDDPRPNFDFRHEHLNIGHRQFKGGYGPMTSGGFRPMHSGGFGARNGGGFGPRNRGGYGPVYRGGFRPMDNADFDPPPLLEPQPENFGPGPRSLFAPSEPFTIGRGFGPSGPPKINKITDNKAFKYLLRCGVPSEQMRHVPASILQLMEPEQCGVCALEFNSDSVARTHYISKNHQKNMKKWLTQLKDGHYRNAKELPFKSRDLYCELCDVHITSKSHANSHYAGKAHRAIVEGRKMPRNPLLHQPGMSSRMEQLLRREKKSIKPLEEGEPKVEKGREPRPFQAELYCKICKTSVTCSEQMTTHLNGKRHLSKEKNHILKTMKGENKDDSDKEQENEDGDDDDDEEGGGKEVVIKKDDDNADETKDVDGDDKESDYSWGNGSGTWDEPECL